MEFCFGAMSLVVLDVASFDELMFRLGPENIPMPPAPPIPIYSVATAQAALDLIEKLNIQPSPAEPEEGAALVEGKYVRIPTLIRETKEDVIRHIGIITGETKESFAVRGKAAMPKDEEILLLSWMDHFLQDACIQALFCSMFTVLLQNDENNERLYKAGLMDLVFNSMDQWVDDQHVQHFGISILFNLLVDHPERALGTRCTEVVTRAMERYKDHRNIQLFGCLVLEDVGKNQSMRAEMIHHHAVTRCMEAMATFRPEKDVVIAGYAAMKTIAAERGYYDQVKASGVKCVFVIFE